MTAEAVPQHLAALALANEIRLARGEMKRQLRNDGHLLSPLRVAYILCEADRQSWLDGMTLFDLIDACPRFGRARILRLLSQAQISELATVGSATNRQRQALANALDDLVRDRLTRRERMAFERQLRAERVG